jgi:hypothetical protein
VHPGLVERAERKRPVARLAGDAAQGPGGGVIVLDDTMRERDQDAVVDRRPG